VATPVSTTTTIGRITKANHFTTAVLSSIALSQLDPLAARQRAGDLIEHGLNDQLDIRHPQMWVAGPARSAISSALVLRRN
jgi:hypothetical protein